MPERARAVVIGGGVIGCSVLYHLAKQGWTDSLLVEQYQLTHGSTWHSAGLVGQLRSSLSLTRMMQYSVGLYAELKELTGNDPGWRQLGGLRLASSQPRLEEIRRQASWAKTFGLPMEIVSADEAQALFPPMSTDGVLAAAYIADDGYLDPSQLTFSLADAARRLGAQIEVRTTVTGIETRDGRVVAVETDQGRDRVRGRRRRGGHVRAADRAAWSASTCRSSRTGTSTSSPSRSSRRSSRCRRCATPTTSSTSAPRSADSSWAATSAGRRRGRSTASRTGSRRSCCRRTGTGCRSCSRTRSAACRRWRRPR